MSVLRNTQSAALILIWQTFVFFPWCCAPLYGLNVLTALVRQDTLRHHVDTKLHGSPSSHAFTDSRAFGPAVTVDNHGHFLHHEASPPAHSTMHMVQVGMPYAGSQDIWLMSFETHFFSRVETSSQVSTHTLFPNSGLTEKLSDDRLLGHFPSQSSTFN